MLLHSTHVCSGASLWQDKHGSDTRRTQCKWGLATILWESIPRTLPASSLLTLISLSQGPGIQVTEYMGTMAACSSEAEKLTIMVSVTSFAPLLSLLEAHRVLSSLTSCTNKHALSLADHGKGVGVFCICRTLEGPGLP